MPQSVEEPVRTPAPAGDPSGRSDPAPAPDESPDKSDAPEKPAKKHRGRRWARRGFFALVFLVVVLGVIRAILPWAVRAYVNRTIDQSPLYDGQIGDVDIHLWRGAYSIEDIRLNKVTGNVPVPLYAAKQVDFSVQWDALFAGKVVGRIEMLQPELNFVDAAEESEDQTGNGGGPWLEMIEDLFPFKINSCRIVDGSIRFHAIDTNPPAEVHLTQVNATIENLGNIHDEVTPLVTTVKATALAMDHATVEYEMKLDPFSYRPTFRVALRMIGLDVTKTNQLARAYGAFDFEHGWFDLVIELDAKEGQLEGYIKPLFRNVKVLSLKRDVREDDVLRVFWEALVGGVSELLENQPRDQIATLIPLRGDLTGPETDVLTVLGNVLHNAFIRAYLPRLRGTAEDVAADGLEFGPGRSVTEPPSVGND
jgi:hypothetical protein